jgi:hypothetical protein
MALDKANSLTDEELANEIALLESGKRKLSLPDDSGRSVPLNALILPVFRRELEKRKQRNQG